MKLASSAIAGPSDPSLPHNTNTETVLQRDDWMLLPKTTPTLPSDARKPLQIEEISMTDEYGEPSESQRTLGGGVDFFSSLGTDIKKKPRPEKPNPDKVSLPIAVP